MPTSARPITRCTPGRARGPCPTKISCRAAPMCAAVQRTSCNVSLRGRTAPVAIRTSRQRSCLRRLPFFLRRKKGRKERRQNQWFWNPFRGQDTARSGTLQPRELSTAKFAPCFRIVSASPSATRSALVLAWRDGGASASAVGRREGTPPYGGLPASGAQGSASRTTRSRACTAPHAKNHVIARTHCARGNP